MYNPKVDSISKDEGELNVAKRLLSRVVEENEKLVTAHFNKNRNRNFKKRTIQD